MYLPTSGYDEIRSDETVVPRTTPYNFTFFNTGIMLTSFLGEQELNATSFPHDPKSPITVTSYRMASGNLALTFEDGDQKQRDRIPEWVQQMSAIATLNDKSAARVFWDRPTDISAKEFFRFIAVIFTPTSIAHMGLSFCEEPDYLIPYQVIARENQLFSRVYRNGGELYPLGNSSESTAIASHFCGYAERSDNHVSMVFAGASNSIPVSFARDIFSRRRHIGYNYGEVVETNKIIYRDPSIPVPEVIEPDDEKKIIMMDTTGKRNHPRLVTAMKHQGSNVILGLVCAPPIGRIIT